MNAKLLSTNDAKPGRVQKFYEMTPPYHGKQHVIISALRAAVDTGMPETYIFAADNTGKIVDWCEMPGSRRGTSDVAEILTEIGYAEVA